MVNREDQRMKDCKDCELAVYCYSDPNSWTFRTKDQMRDVSQRMSACERFRGLRRQDPESDPEAGAADSGSRPKAAGIGRSSA